MKDIEYIFLGGMFPKEMEDEINRNTKANMQQAANIFQWNIIEAIEATCAQKLHLISAAYIGAFPHCYKKMIIHGCQWSHSKNCQDDYVGFINLFGVKEILRSRGTKNALRRVMREKKSKQIILFVYAMNTALLKAAVYAKENAKDEDVHICLICPDLPQYMNMGNGRGKIFEILKKVDGRKQQKLLKQVDSYVFLTKYMNDVVNKENKPWCVVEGVARPSLVQQPAKGKQNRIMLYSGGICEEYGVYDLLRVFQAIDSKSWKLYLCGHVETQIKEKYESEKIEFLGALPNAKVKELQKGADLLVNPRKNTGEFVRYSFPSKTIEYLTSGTAVLMYELEGVSEEYFQYLYTVEKCGGTLEKALREVMGIDAVKLEEKGQAGQEFVLNHKDPITQGNRIMSMILGEKKNEFI